MPIHKLADGPIVLTVAQVTSVPSNYNPDQMQLKITGEDGTDVYVNEGTATKQLARIGLTVEGLVGQTIHLEQVVKNGTRYTNINKATPGTTAPRAASSAPGQAPVSAPLPKQTLGELAGIYGECVSYAMATLGAKCEEAGVPIDAAAIQSAAATLFIKVTR